MKRLLKSLNVLVFSLAVFTAQQADAQTNPCIETGEHTAPRSGIAKISGEDGIWFRMDVARCLLGEVEKIPINAQKIKLLEQQLAIKAQETLLLREALTLSEGVGKELRAALVAETARANRIERDKNAWYRSPWLWFAVGTVVTSGAIVGASKL